MRCYFSSDDEMSPPAYNIWTSGTLQAPNILKSILNLNVSDASCFAENLTSLCTIDSTSPSQKRKILDCEKEDFEERFHKVQRRKQIKKVESRATLVVDDNEDPDDEDKIYEQMDWVERENRNSVESYESDSEDELLSDSEQGHSVLFIPRLNLKDERRRLLRISMAKIRCVDDPEAYLRRSVLINNTVRRLQKDIPLTSKCSVPSVSFLEENSSHNENTCHWDNSLVHKQNESDVTNVGCVYESSSNNDLGCTYTEINKHTDAASAQIQCSDLPKSLHMYDHESIHIDTIFCCKTSQDEQKLNIEQSPSLVLKHSSPVSMFSAQPCGLQYRNSSQAEDSIDDYRELSSSSLINSVVYSSLMASLET